MQISREKWSNDERKLIIHLRILHILNLFTAAVCILGFLDAYGSLEQTKNWCEEKLCCGNREDIVIHDRQILKNSGAHIHKIFRIFK